MIDVFKIVFIFCSLLVSAFLLTGCGSTSQQRVEYAPAPPYIHPAPEYITTMPGDAFGEKRLEDTGEQYSFSDTGKLNDLQPAGLDGATVYEAPHNYAPRQAVSGRAKSVSCHRAARFGDDAELSVDFDDNRDSRLSFDFAWDDEFEHEDEIMNKYQGGGGDDNFGFDGFKISFSQSLHPEIKKNKRPCEEGSAVRGSMGFIYNEVFSEGNPAER